MAHGEQGQLDAAIRGRGSSSVEARIAAVEALAELGGPAATEELLRALDDEAPPVRSAAAYALGEVGDARATRRLIEALESSDEQAEAASALGKLRDARAFRALVSALSAEELRVQAAAARALGELGEPGAITPLLDVVNDKSRDPGIRSVAGKALGRLDRHYASGDGRSASFFFWAAGAALIGGAKNPIAPREGDPGGGDLGVASWGSEGSGGGGGDGGAA